MSIQVILQSVSLPRLAYVAAAPITIARVVGRIFFEKLLDRDINPLGLHESFGSDLEI